MNSKQPSRGVLNSVLAWFMHNKDITDVDPERAQKIDWVRALPFIGMHLGCLAVIGVGWSWLAVTVAVLLYALRVFALTAFFHRYFAHRAFKTWRPVQFAFAAIGGMAVQRGALWWAAH